MFKAHKEIIWHITCTVCKFYWTYATMEEKYRIDRGQFHCPGCGAKSSVKVDK
jgi:ssDNA-binding Zn-finger/Zn-ribbon topoisomerase 1